MAERPRLTGFLKGEYPSYEVGIDVPLKPHEWLSTKMSPVTPQEVHTGQHEAKLNGRRPVLKGFVYTAAGILAPTGLVLGTIKHVLDVDASRTEPNILRREGNVQFVDRETRNRFPHSATLVFRGFNVDQIDNSGKALSPYLNRYGQVASIDYGNTRFEPDGEITQNTIKFLKEKNITSVDLWGRSMGGMVALNMVEALHDANIKIRSVVFEATPGSNDDVIGYQEGDEYMIQFYNKMVELGYASYGGQDARTRAEAAASDILRSRDPRKTDPIRKSHNELPNNIVLQQIGFISSFHPSERTAEILRDVPMAYIAAKGGIGDNTVNVMQSCDRLRSYLPGCDLRLYEREGIWHASASDQPDIYGEIALQFRKDTRLPIYTAV